VEISDKGRDQGAEDPTLHEINHHAYPAEEKEENSI
jgi:hypothetical protein